MVQIHEEDVTKRTSIKKEERKIGIDQSKWTDYYLKEKRLIHKVAHIFWNSPHSHEELFAVANIGFVKALQTFDSKRKVKFVTYAYTMMYHEILRFLKEDKKYVGTLLNEKEKEHIDLGIKESQGMGEFLNHRPESFNEPLEKIEENELIEQMQYFVSNLSEKERLIIIHRYGLYGEEMKTQKEVGEIVGLLQSTVSKTEKFALKKLRHMIEGQKDAFVYNF